MPRPVLLFACAVSALLGIEGMADVPIPTEPESVFVPGDLPQAEIPAFPGAEGGGMYAFGGRGGQVYVVTSLADSGPGTFREALEAEGPRMVVFNVAGIIRLESPVLIDSPYITVAGHTAPGDGVCIAGETVDITTHDVVLRYMRFRRGITDEGRRDDALSGNPIGNIMIDHCSFSWGLDENISLYRRKYGPPTGDKPLIGPTRNLTIQWSISSEALDTYDHGFGSTLGGRNMMLHHNLWANNTGRNPSIGMGFSFNFINNVVYNWGHRTMNGGDHRSRVNAINNYFKPGPATNEDAIRIGNPNSTSDRADPGLRRSPKWYVSGNYMHGHPEITNDNWAGIDGDEADIRSLDPFPMAPVTIHDAQRAFERVLAEVGASLPRRDAVDRRIMAEVRSGEATYKAGNGIITDISQVGGYPEYTGEPYADRDSDGMPDWWERRFGLDPENAADASIDSSGDGYTNIECFLNGLDPHVFIDWRDPAANYERLRLPQSTLVRAGQ